jgi:septum formation protein
MLQHIQHLYPEKLYLASQSPRRAHLLSLIGFDFTVMTAQVDEQAFDERDPIKHCTELSLAKARNVAERIDKGLVIGADTIVVLDNEILGKPADTDEAARMLGKLSNNSHKVYTGFALVEQPSKRTVSDYEVTSVHFRDLQEWEITSYVRTQNPLDKAGAYGIQDQSAVFADRIEGCFYNVVGFPLSKFYKAFVDFVNSRTR